MMLIFAVLISFTGLGIAGTFIFAFRNGYSSLSQVYLQDITRQTTNNLENNIQKIEDINLQILTSQTVQDQLKIVNEEKLDTYGLRQCRQKIERELTTDGLYASYVVSVSVISLEGIEFSVKKQETIGILRNTQTALDLQKKRFMKLTEPAYGDWQVIRTGSAWQKLYWTLIRCVLLVT